MADGDDARAKIVEGNKSVAPGITIGADLVISSLTVPSDGGAGVAITFTDTTRNSGAGTAAASTTSYYLSAESGLDCSHKLTCDRAVPALSSVASMPDSGTATVPGGTATRKD